MMSLFSSVYTKMCSLIGSTIQYSLIPHCLYKSSFCNISLLLVDGDNTSITKVGVPLYFSSLSNLSLSQMMTMSGRTTLILSSSLKRVTSNGDVSGTHALPLSQL